MLILGAQAPAAAVVGSVVVEDVAGDVVTGATVVVAGAVVVVEVRGGAVVGVVAGAVVVVEAGGVPVPGQMAVLRGLPDRASDVPVGRTESVSATFAL